MPSSTSASRVASCRSFFDLFNSGSKKWFFLGVGSAGPLHQPLDKNFYTSIGKLSHSHDHRDRANGIYGIRVWVLVSDFPLRGQEDQPVFRQGLIHSANAGLSPHKEWEDHVRVYDYVPYREEW